MIVRALHRGTNAISQYPNFKKIEYPLILGNIQYPVFRSAGPYCFTIDFVSILCFRNLYIVSGTILWYIGFLKSVYWYIRPPATGPYHMFLVYEVAVDLWSNIIAMKWQWIYGPTLLLWPIHFHIRSLL